MGRAFVLNDCYRFKFQTAGKSITAIASEAKQSMLQQRKEVRVDCFAALAMTSEHSFAISPRVSREFC
jgi:hypothetical protein